MFLRPTPGLFGFNLFVLLVFGPFDTLYGYYAQQKVELLADILLLYVVTKTCGNIWFSHVLLLKYTAINRIAVIIAWFKGCFM